jgi:hypothetical protein
MLNMSIHSQLVVGVVALLLRRWGALSISRPVQSGMTQSILLLTEVVGLFSNLDELRAGCARPITPRDVLNAARVINHLMTMMSLIQPNCPALPCLAGMVSALPQVLPVFAALVVVVLVLVALLPRLRRVSLDALRIGPVSFGPIRIFFATPRPRAALPSAGPALLPSRAGKRSRPRSKLRPAKSCARAKGEDASRARVAPKSPRRAR